MTMRSIPGAAAISEFIAGYNGDCGETAELAALHVVNPSAYPLDAAALSAIVKRDVAHGWASSNGSEPISAIASDLAALGIAHTNYGYAEPFTVDWQAQLGQYGGIKPLIFEYARAASLPGDESGVAYHFNTCLAWDTSAGAGLFADGDNAVERSGGTALVRYTLADLQAAHVCGMLVLDYAIGGVTMSGVPTGWHDDGTTLTAPNGITVGTGFRGYILAAASWDAAELPESRELSVSSVELADPTQGAGTVQYFRHAQLNWTAKRGVWLSWVGLEAYTGRQLLQAAQDQITQLQAHLTTTQALVTSLQAQLAAAQTAAAGSSTADALVAAIKAAIA